jgi:hypothetical protein
MVPDDLARQLRASASSAAGSLLLQGAEYDAAKVAWYLSNAEVLIAASEFEAYGLTPVEAGLHGCRTVVSDIPAHREVCQDSARYFNVGDIAGLASEIHAALGEPKPEPWTVTTTWKDTAGGIADAVESVGALR